MHERMTEKDKELIDYANALRLKPTSQNSVPVVLMKPVQPVIN